MAQTKIKHQPCLNVILLGDAGVGKSASGNTILGRTAFSAGTNTKTLKSFQKESVTIDGLRVDVIDTPALLNIESNKEKSSELCKVLLQLDPTSPMVFLLVFKAGSFTEKEKRYVEEIEKRLGDWRFNTWILFTRGDELMRKNTTVEKWVEGNAEIKRLVKRFQNKYHVFDNKARRPDQVKKLIQAIKNAPLSMLPEIRSFHRTIPDKNNNLRQTRIVLLGKTGTGKSATANTILGEERFRSEFSLSSVTEQCERHQAEVAGRMVSVIDTPGLFDTRMSPVELAEELGRSVHLSSPGPHAYLYVVPLNIRFTEQEVDVVQKVEAIFGEEIRRHTIILFTHGELLQGRNADAEIRKNPALTRLISRCWGYHIFNNNDRRNREQVTELLQKIDRMVEDNGQSYYSNQMYEAAEEMDETSFLRKYWAHLLLGGVIGAAAAPLAGVAVAIGAIAGSLFGLFSGMAGVRVKIQTRLGTRQLAGIGVGSGGIGAACGIGLGSGIVVEVGVRNVSVVAGLGAGAGVGVGASTEAAVVRAGIGVGAGLGLQVGSVTVGAGLGVGVGAGASTEAVWVGTGVGAGLGLGVDYVKDVTGVGVGVWRAVGVGTGGAAVGDEIGFGAGLGRVFDDEDVQMEQS